LCSLELNLEVYSTRNGDHDLYVGANHHKISGLVISNKVPWTGLSSYIMMQGVV
jgi:hypothetical protein